MKIALWNYFLDDVLQILKEKIMTTTDNKLAHWMATHGVALLRISIGIIFLWFGFIKYFPGLSPIEDLAVRTTRVLTFNLFSDSGMAAGLATLECLIGIGLLTGKFLRVTLLLLLFQLVGAISPVFIFPHEVFKIIPIAPTLAGQYIIKDIVIISAWILLGGTVRGGKMIADPIIADKAKQVENAKMDNENNWNGMIRIIETKWTKIVGKSFWNLAGKRVSMN